VGWQTRTREAGLAPPKESAELFGRDNELTRIAAFVDGGAARALVLHGEAGIGKTVLWRAGLERARAAGSQVLVARPAESEASLSFSALGDLLADAGDAIGALPDPQRRALRIALLLEDADGSATDARALSVAVLRLLRELAGEGPVLLAVDDVQWLDPPTLGALAYARRRLDGEPVGFLGAARPHAFAPAFERVERLEVGPLDLSALDRVIRRSLGTQFARPVLRRVENVSGGNPFYALELARAMLRRQDPVLAVGSLPLPETLTDVVRERVEALSPEAREALLVVAALSTPTRDLVEAAVGKPEALMQAVEEHVVVIEGDRVRLDHPLLGSVAYAAERLERRRTLHRRLAGIVSGPEDRARHLAIASEGPDEDVADALEDAARGARKRGAAEAAAELAELAIQLTPATATEVAVRRRALAGDCYFAAGDARRAETLLEEVVEAMPEGPARARILWRLAAVKAAVEGPPGAFPLYERALDESGDDVRLQAQIHDRLATWHWISRGAAAAEPHARALVELAERVGEPALLARAIGALLALQVVQGRGLDRPRYERMLELELEADDHGVELPGSTLHHQLLTWTGAYEESRERALVFFERARERGEAAQILPLWCLGYIDFLTGKWRDALARIELALELVEQTRRDALVPGVIGLRSAVWAALGDAGRATSDAEHSRRLAEASGQHSHVLMTDVALGTLALAAGDVHAAHERFAAVGSAVDFRGAAVVAEFWFPDEVEARVAVGDVDEADRRLVEFERDAKRHNHPRSLAIALRCRALVAFGRGEADAALAAIESALRYHAKVDDAYQLGRTFFALGSIQRRLQLKAAATESLERALVEFEAVGAALWADRARRELARIGGRRSSGAALTGTEQQIADLVASGKSNAEVAQTLSISVKTVEWNLSKIYRKLHVASRTELAAKLRS
jgi:DNA-binding CsgD family transcriptional regulator